MLALDLLFLTEEWINTLSEACILIWFAQKDIVGWLSVWTYKYVARVRARQLLVATLWSESFQMFSCESVWKRRIDTSMRASGWLQHVQQKKYQIHQYTVAIVRQRTYNLTMFINQKPALNVIHIRLRTKCRFIKVYMNEKISCVRFALWGTDSRSGEIRLQRPLTWFKSTAPMAHMMRC